MFSTRLKELRAASGHTQKQVAEALGITDRAYQHYELDKRKPDYLGLIALADFFGVSIDYLTERSNNPNINH